MSRPESLGLAYDLYATAQIRQMNGEYIAAEYADFTRSRFTEAYFSDDGVQPLFIPARNEAEDLPGTLLAAASADVFPIVLNNCSTDNTAAIAKTMGATVIDVNEGSKMAATQAGYEIAAELDAQNLYFTDADTLVPPRWMTSMRSRLQTADEGRGSAIFGNGILWHGESRVTDTVLSVGKAAMAAKRLLADEVTPRGYNYAVRTDKADVAREAIDTLDPAMFTWDDIAICRALQKAGVAVRGAVGLSTTVVTRNDRVSSIRQRLSRTYSADRAQAYVDDYGANTTFTDGE